MVDGHIPKQVGSWFRNRLGDRYEGRGSFNHLDYHRGWYEQCIIVPNLFAMRHADDQVDATAVAVESTSSRLSDPQPSNILTRTPDEILILILSLALPFGRVFHFTPQVRSGDQTSTTSVHQLCRTDHCPELNVLSLALVCRRFRNVVYDLFYSSNQFLVEVSPMRVPLAAWINGAYSGYRTQRQFSSWNRIHRTPANSTTSHPLFPLTPTTLRFITDLKVCISLTYIPESELLDANSESMTAMCAIQQLCTCLGNEENRFKSLAIRLDIAKLNGSRHDTHQLRVSYKWPLRHFHRWYPAMDFFDIVLLPVELTDGQKAGLQRMCAALLKLADERGVSLHGALVRREGNEGTIQRIPDTWKTWNHTVTLRKEDMVFLATIAGGTPEVLC